MKKSILAIAVILGMAACTSNPKDTETTEDEAAVNIPDSPFKKAKVDLMSKSGSSVTGNVHLTESNGIVSMIATVKNAAPGMHAIHIHAEGDCSAKDGSSARGHWNPTDQTHGKWGEGSFHVGDIGNIEIGENGEGFISRDTDMWCIGCKDANKDILGKAIIVHEGLDDFTSQPSGAAGPRVACGEIMLNEE